MGDYFSRHNAVLAIKDVPRETSLILRCNMLNSINIATKMHENVSNFAKGL